MQREAIIMGILIGFLGLLSTVVLYSIAPKAAPDQLFFVLAGVVVYAIIQQLEPRLFFRMSPVAFLSVLAMLVLTIFIGRLSKGAVRWLPIGPVHIQPSEFAKPVLALTLAAIGTIFPLVSTQRILFFSIPALFLIGLTFLQPDLGSALVLTVILLTGLYFGVKRLILLIPFAITGVAVSALLWQFFLYDYQKQRIFSFFSPESTATTSGYNAQQALISLGSGQLFGRGLGHGVQSGLRFLPEHYTDFFIASLSEELGFLGLFLVGICYLFMVIVLLKDSEKLSRFSQLSIIGIAAAFLFQACINIGMNMHLFPVTGIPLPFLSSGGSSFISMSIAFGIAMRLHALKNA